MASISANGITVEYETAGDPSHPPMLLVMGLGAQLITWPDSFVDGLVSSGFFVVRFDNRDAGLSTWFDEAGPPDLLAALAGKVSPAYLLSDMAADAVGLMDGLGIESAHVVGASMGGMIAQTIAISAPDRVRSLVSIMSTTGARDVGQPHAEVLPLLLRPAATSRAEAVDAGVTAARAIGSPTHPMAEPDVRARVGEAYDRAYHPVGTARQLVAILASGDRTEALTRLEIPTLVIHGDADPLVDPTGGKATAAAIPGSEIRLIPGMGHDLPAELCPAIVDAIAAHAHAHDERLSGAESAGVSAASGPLAGLKIVELAGIGPAPFAAMVLADFGADIIRIDRAAAVKGGDPDSPPPLIWDRSRRSVAVDLKAPEGVETVLRLVEQADAFIEGFRPGVTERLGLGPDACRSRNPRLVYGRMTGWGQDGPYASTAGHDINYIALAGSLDPIGRAGQPPLPPLNLVGDFGGGGMLLALGVCAALLEAARSGQGQVVDAAMVDGAALLTTMIHAFRAMGTWSDQRGTNLLDTGAHFYEVYETADAKFVSIGSIEPQFYAELLRLTGLEDDPDFAAQMDRSRWPELKDRLARVFRTKTRDEWCALMEGTDVCFAPVLGMGEAPQHPHIRARGTFTEVAGVVQPAPAPRFSRTPAHIQRPPSHAGQHTDDALQDWGFTIDEVAALREAGAIR